MPKTLNIAVIGAGTMAQAVHLPVLRRRWDRFSVVALVDHSPRRRREASEVWGIEEEKRYETVADLIAAVRAKTITLDGAVLSTDGLHVEDLLLLMRRGIPVLVEPPLGYSVEEIAKVADFERMTGRRLVMMAHPQQYDDSVSRMAEHIAVKDLRMVDHEVLMPASQPLFGGAHVTTSSYDLPTEVRSERRKALQAAVEAGAGDGASQRDRDLYVKGLLTGMSHQMSVIEASYGPIARLSAVRHWPKGVIPGSLELQGELEGGAQVRLVWHYLPFAPEYSETLQVLSARRRMRVELPAPSHGDERSSVSLREKKSGVVQELSTTAPKGSAELMWEAFHAFVEKGKEPISGAAEARDQVALLREVLSHIVVADGRSLEAEKTEDDAAPADESTSRDATAEEPVVAGGATGVAAGAASAPAADEPAAETLEQPLAEEELGTTAGTDGATVSAFAAADEVTDVWGPDLAPSGAAAPELAAPEADALETDGPLDGDSQSGAAEPDAAEPVAAEPVAAEPGTATSDTAESVAAEPGTATSDTAESDAADATAGEAPRS